MFDVGFNYVCCMIVYGIPNCNTVKKALTWLDENGFRYEFHDFKKKGITAEKLTDWCTAFGSEKVLNKKGSTWRKLTEEEQEQTLSKAGAISILRKYTSAIKRPVIEKNGKAVLIGFDEVAYATQLK